MCNEINNGNSQTKNELEKLINDSCVWNKLYSNNKINYKDMCSRFIYTCYMGTVHSSKETQNRARELAHSVGANF